MIAFICMTMTEYFKFSYFEKQIHLNASARASKPEG